MAFTDGENMNEKLIDGLIKQLVETSDKQLIKQLGPVAPRLLKTSYICTEGPS